MPSSGSVFPYEAVLWDIDGTLADSEPVHLQSFISACSELGVSLPDGFHDQLVGKTDKATYQWLRDTCGLELSLNDWVEKRFEYYFQHIDDVRPHASAINLWCRLKKIGVAQATVSNSDRMIVQRNLDRLGINKPEFVSVALNDVRAGKPDPEPYLRAAHLLGVDAKKCAVVEDSATGALAGLKAGMTVYVMPWFEGVVTSDLSEFADLAAKMD